MKTSSLWTGAVCLALVGVATALPASGQTSGRPNVVISSGTIVGKSFGAIESFNGIPFADPPVGNLRLKPPRKLSTSLGTLDAGGIAAACPQMFLSTKGQNLVTNVLAQILTLPILQVVNGQEDCLTVNVQRPAGTSTNAKLPVLVWIFGGGFELGSSSMYDASGLIANGVSQGKPFVFVGINYRVGGFGFLPGKEVLADGSANLGLLDQRLALQWVADNIAAFGGDPAKVTLWGESAGAISVMDQMLLYGGDNKYNGRALFRGAIMNSGSVVPAAPVDCPKGQAVYDAVVAAAGCSGSADTLGCLRRVDYTTFLQATNSVPGILSYNSVALSYLPRPDGTALPRSPDFMVAANQYAAVPMIIGDQEDEGTLFALFQPNLSSTAAVVDYLSKLYFPQASKADLTALVNTYSPLLTEGSPFGTGLFNELYPGFKRLAALLGDLVFTLSRRAFLTSATSLNPSVPAYSYLASYDYGTPVMGTFHGSDLLQVFYGILPNYASKSIQTYYINFLYNLDPNVGATGYPRWPQWREKQQLMQFFSMSSALLKDDFRSDSYNWIVSHMSGLYV